MKRVLGYILSIAGIIALLAGVKPTDVLIRKFLPYMVGVQNTPLMIAGIVLIVIGIIILKGAGGGRQLREVPIYHGKNVVGYRRQR
mgnify:CR=1 FL=1